MKQKILVTGGTGLIGSHLLEALSFSNQYEVFVLGRNLKLSDRDNNIIHIDIDLAKDWDESILPENLFAIVHLAQAENFRMFPEKAKEVFYINTLSTLKLINYATEKKLSHFIYASSGGIYGNGDKAFVEDVVNAYEKKTGFYIATKHSSEVILENYFNELNVFILRFFFVYGEGQKKEMLIPRLINFVKNGDPITLQGNSGIEINPIYVKDAVLAILATLKLNESHTINIGGQDVLSLRSIGELVGLALNKKPQFIVNDSEIPKNLIGDITKMKNLLHVPQISFKQIINKLI